MLRDNPTWKRHTHLALACAAALLACPLIHAQGRWIEGTYRNPSLGYAIDVPRGLKGRTGDQGGPERGFRVTLPSGATIGVWGEPNSLEFKTPAEGIRNVLASAECAGRKQTLAPIRIGQLSAAEGTVTCNDRVIDIVLAFRPGGGPIYWLRLETKPSDVPVDRPILLDMASSLRMIRWE